MQTSDQRILTTHVGSLPRPRPLADLLIRQERGEAIDEAALQRQVEAAVDEVVRGQLDAGIDVGNDGEQPRVGFQTYVAQRMQGFGGESARPQPRDWQDFPDYAAIIKARRRRRLPRCNTPTSAPPKTSAPSSCAAPSRRRARSPSAS